MERFLDCVNYKAHKPLSSSRIENIISIVGALEEVKDIRSLIFLLAGE
jgi:hypothetical protein